MRRSFAGATVAAAAVLLPGLAGPPARAAGRIAVWQPTTISQPGHYVLTRDLAVTDGSTVVRIFSPDVVLDLNGRTITTAGGGIAVDIIPSTPAAGSVEIRNGRIRGDGPAVRFSSGMPVATRLRLEDLDVSTTSVPGPILVSGAPVVEILRCEVHDSVAFPSAIHVDSGWLTRWSGTIAGNRVREAGGDGIVVSGMASGIVSDNLVDMFGTLGIDSQSGISVSGTIGDERAAVHIERNVVRGAGPPLPLAGILLTSWSNRTSVVDNVVVGMDVGISVLTDGNSIRGNVIGGTGGSGINIHLGDGNTVARNLIESGLGDGVRITLGDNNLIDSNSIEGHFGWGISVSGTGNAYRGNMLRNNITGAVTGTATDEGGNIP
jgi:hypothetical protein